jgi:hypothetical protein
VARLANVESPDNGVIQGHRVRPANADQPDQKGTRASRAAKPDVPATAARRGHGERLVRRVMPAVRVHRGCRGSQAERGVWVLPALRVAPEERDRPASPVGRARLVRVECKV